MIYDENIWYIHTKYTDSKLNFKCKQIREELEKCGREINNFEIKIKEMNNEYSSVLENLFNFLKIDEMKKNYY